MDAPAVAVGREVWPRHPGVFSRVATAPETEPAEQIEPAEEAADADPPLREPPKRELAAGQFGLVPRWVKSASDAKLRSTKLVNARSETVTTSSNFRDAWLAGQRCIVPASSFDEPNWESGKNVWWQFRRAAGAPWGVAGLWRRWIDPATGAWVDDYKLLTRHSNAHAVMNHMDHNRRKRTGEVRRNERPGPARDGPSADEGGM